MEDDSRDNNRTAEYRPLARTLAQNQENPNWVQQRLDETDDARVERANAFGDAFRE